MVTDPRTAMKPTKYRWVVMTVIFLTYVVCMADRSNIGTLLPFIAEEFHISNSEKGLIASMFFLGYAISQIPAGLIMGRFGTRNMVTYAVLSFSIITFLMGFPTTAMGLIILRLLLGLTEGPTPVGMTSTINNWFPKREKGTATGIYIASTQLAPMLVPPLVVLLVHYLSWRHVFWVFAVPGIIMAIVWHWLVRSAPRESSRVNAAELRHIEHEEAEIKAATRKEPGWMKGVDKAIRYREVAQLKTNKDVMRSWNVWGDTLAYFFMNNVLYGMLTWIPLYLLEQRGYDVFKMGFVAACPALGGILGAVIGGWVSDRIFFGRRKPTMLITAFFTAVMFVVVLLVPNNVALVALSLILTGFFLNLGWPMFTAFAMNQTTEKTYPFTISIINSGGNLGGFFAPIVVGILLDKTGSYNVAFSYFVVVLLIAFVILLTMKEPKPQEKVEGAAA
ncbi:MFS transporter [Actinotignum urinale]|uniref:MFS transporter n=1 Tax=Actinotignum urinale TaxID=190146 RepID=A0ABU5G6V5_9ACTO|nr:MFS transporter [Actinotignum urinale]MDY5132789.1 MFS transporter [Actinotignum urinale]MDY5159800.1 MFS transporter [Actinotignum urinale]